MSNPFNLDIVKKNFDQLVVKDIPTRLANLARNFFAASWRKQGWDDGGVTPWKEVERRIKGTKAWLYPKKKGLGRRTRAINVKSGDLRKAVQDSVKESTFKRIRFLVDVPYAGYVNDGTDHMPARPFMKDSKTLTDRLEKKIETTIDKIWEK